MKKKSLLRRLFFIPLLYLLIGVIAWLSITFITGKVIKNNYKAEIERITIQINEQLNEIHHTYGLHYVDINVKKYERFWFYSQFNLQVTDIINTKTYHINNLMLEHGPFPSAAIDKGEYFPKMIAMNYELPNLFNEMIKTDQSTLLSTYMDVGYLKKSRLFINFKSFDYNNDNDVINVEPFSAFISLIPKNNGVITQFSLKTKKIIVNDNVINSVDVNSTMSYSIMNNNGELSLSFNIVNPYGPINYNGSFKTLALNRFLTQLVNKRNVNQFIAQLLQLNVIRSNLNVSMESFAYILTLLNNITHNTNKIASETVQTFAIHLEETIKQTPFIRSLFIIDDAHYGHSDININNADGIYEINP